MINSLTSIFCAVRSFSSAQIKNINLQNKQPDYGSGKNWVMHIKEFVEGIKWFEHFSLYGGIFEGLLG